MLDPAEDVQRVGILGVSNKGIQYHYSQFTDEETKAQNG